MLPCLALLLFWIIFMGSVIKWSTIGVYFTESECNLSLIKLHSKPWFYWLPAKRERKWNYEIKRYIQNPDSTGLRDSKKAVEKMNEILERSNSMDNLIALSPLLLWVFLAALLLAVLVFIVKRSIKRNGYKKKIQALEENRTPEETHGD